MKAKTLTLVLLAPALLGVAGCATTTAMDLYVPDHCHGAQEAFDSYTVAYQNVPGFIEEVIDTALTDSLAASGLEHQPEGGDVRVLASFDLIDRNPPPTPPDPFGEEVSSSSVNRFVTHLKVDIFDQRSGKLVWTGAMYRPHAIEGGETFHDDRAVLIIRQAFDDMFVGLTTPCE